jgi:GNAT superfamily N-acetyltransferase
LFRNPVHVRDAGPADAGDLRAIWADFSKRGPDGLEASPVAETATAVALIAADPDERLLVGVLEDRVVGTMHLRRTAVSPVHSQTAIHTSHLHVLDGWRRRGVGRALLEAAVTWAEEKDTGHILAASAMNSRDANRFMARLGLGQIAVVRGATVPALRAKLPGEAAAVARIGTRQDHNLGQLLAHRRSLRRSQLKSR